MIFYLHMNKSLIGLLLVTLIVSSSCRLPTLAQFVNEVKTQITTMKIGATMNLRSMNSVVPNPTDKEILQQGLNGLFEQNKLPDPTTIIPCLDDKTAHDTVVFIGQSLEKGAKGSVGDLLSLIKLVENFGNNIDPKVKACLDGNVEFKNLGLKYGITDETTTEQIEKKIITYITLHYSEVHKEIGTVNDMWKAGKYYQAGFESATYGHKIFKMDAIPNLTDKEILQQALDGLFEPNKLPDTTTVVPCFDDDSAKLTVAFVGRILHDLAQVTLTNPSAIKKIK